MSRERAQVFKIASEDWEIEEIHRLNYRTFVEEIPQHEPNPSQKMVDRFHHENTYVVALNGSRRLVGMMAVRGKRPFSLDEKLGAIDRFLPPGRSICEIRLLSVLPEYRNGATFQGLMKVLVDFCLKSGYNFAVISGTVRQLKLYKHLGFVPFGPLVGPPEAQFQPMYLTLEAYQDHAMQVIEAASVSADLDTAFSFLPGPVSISPGVRRALDGAAISHRSGKFKDQFTQTKERLCTLVKARHVEILLGSGTLANDVIAAQLSLHKTRGLILTNGEFGCRLADHATRVGLPFEVAALEWGQVFERADIEKKLDAMRPVDWLWAAACETSTGILNNVPMLVEICASRNVKLCLDCISAVGAVPLDLSAVYLASGVSGKGLGSYPGISMVFYSHAVHPEPTRLPRYLDLGFYSAQSGIPFTHSSNLLSALQMGLKRFDTSKPFEELVNLSNWLRPKLREMGLTVLADGAHAAPAVITLVLPASISSEAVGLRLQEQGFLLSFQSEYLLSRNWIQICLMGDCSRRSIGMLLPRLKDAVAAAGGASAAKATLRRHAAVSVESP